MGDRAVDCARLESVCAERHRGFESPPIRQGVLFLLVIGSSLQSRRLALALFEYLQFLPQFDHAAVREDATEIYAGIDHTVAADH